MFKKLSDFFLFGSIFIAICAVAMCVETNLLLHLRLNNLSFYLFVFGATLAQYNMHYLFKTTAVENSTRLAWSLKNKNIHKILIAFGVALILYSLFSFHLRHFIFLLALGAIAFLYSFPFLPFTNKKRIKDFGLMKIITLSLLWTLVTVWFPVDEINFTGLSFQLIFLRRFIFIFILCLLFDIRDTEVDRRENIATLSVKVGIKKSYTLCYLLLVVFTALSIIQYIHLPEARQLILMLFSAIATGITIEYSKKKYSDIVYLALIDGMMLLQALLVIFASVIKNGQSSIGQ
ncbi:MAG TPA: UbiA family prenyltransferase [Chitinophagaceae bacterium]